MRLTRTALLPAASAVLLVSLHTPLPGRPPADPEARRTVGELQKERAGVVAERLAQARRAARVGAGVEDEVRFWEHRLAVAEAELEGKADDLRRLYGQRVAALLDAERRAEKLHKAGAGSLSDVLEIRDARLEAEIALARLK